MARLLLTCVALAMCALPARADRAATISLPVERALRVPVVVVGKVTAVEKDAVETTLYPGAGNKVAHKIAVVKVETNLLGAGGTTHLKVGFVTPGTAGVRPGRGPDNPELKEGQEYLFFLLKHHDEAFFVIPYATPPLGSKATKYKEQIEDVKKALAIVADPAKALKAEKAEDRFRAAVILVRHLRSVPEGSYKGVETESLTAEQSRPVLRALAEADWGVARSSEPGLSGYSTFAMLGLGGVDGWKAPAAQPGKDFPELTRAAYAKWLDGPGKDYRIKKFVSKK